jgi:hypothetical protein
MFNIYLCRIVLIFLIMIMVFLHAGIARQQRRQRRLSPREATAADVSGRSERDFIFTQK